jgi:hypothetical protein
MVQYSPRSITCHEDTPASVTKYDVEVRLIDGSGTVVRHIDQFDANPSGDTTIPLGFTDAESGLQIGIFVRQTGPNGALSDWQQVPGFYTVTPIPDGAESIVVNL